MPFSMWIKKIKGIHSHFCVLLEYGYLVDLYELAVYTRQNQLSHLLTKRFKIIQTVEESCCSFVKSCPTLWPGTPGFSVHHYLWSLCKLVSIESMITSNHFILCRPLLLLPSIFPSIRVFTSESALHIRWPKYWSFSFSISPSNEYSGLISFRMDWLDLLAVQRTLKSLLQHHSSKASILWCSAFFMVQLSHPYKTSGKTIALTIWTFVSKVKSLL